MRRASLTLVLVLIAAASVTGGAAAHHASPTTHVWTGAIDSDWSKADNWDDQKTPEDGDIVYLMPGTHPDIENAPGIHLAALYMEARSLTGAGVMDVGTLAWTTGTLGMNVTVEGPGAITGDVTVQGGNDPGGTTLVNNGAMAVGPGITIHVDFGAKIENNGVWSGAKVGNTVTMQSNVCCGELGVFENKGTLNAPAAEPLQIDNMGYDGTPSGTLEGNVILGYGLDKLEDGTKISGSDTTVRFTDKATVTAEGTVGLVDGPTLIQDGGSTLAGTSKALTFKGSGNGTATYDWRSGVITASPTFGDKTGLKLDSQFGKTLGDGNRNHGHLTLTTTATQVGPGILSLAGGSKIVNYGTWGIPAHQDVTIQGEVCCAGPPAFQNWSKLLIDKTSTLTFAQDQFADASSGFVAGGTLALGYGIHLLRNGATLDGVQLELSSKGTLDGSGKLELENGAAFRLGGDASLTGTLDLEGSGTFLWSEGTVGGDLDVGPGVKTEINDITIDHEHDRAVTSLNPKSPAKVTIEGGAVQQSPTPIDVGPGTEVTNRSGSTWKLTGGGFQGGTCCATPATVVNLGTIDAAPPKSTELEQLRFWNRGTFTIESGTVTFSGVDPIQFAGTTKVAGTLTAPDYTLEGGDLLGSGTVTGNLTNKSGNVSPGDPIGTLKVTGAYTQGTGATFTIDLSPSAGDLLTSGPADLGGTLIFHRRQAKTLPRRARTILHARSISHPFAVTTSAASLGGGWKVVTTGGNVRLVPS